ncbi:LysM peptidoglycan-binding domain-containing protein [Streptacidiphilus cavernicola]|uniref:Transglycosylase family protein n=1 Tax=Streptacidiphilus cavernicola TaxID=3342716 RepID=A0ABV6VN14_9ACTN
MPFTSNASGRHRKPRTSNTARLVATASLGTAGIALPLIGATSASAASVSTWDKVASCESGGDWSINTGNGYYGGLQFSASTWSGYGGTAYAATADHASKGQQIAIAEKVLASQGPGAWPVCGPRAGLSQGGAPASVDTGTPSKAGTGKHSGGTEQAAATRKSSSTPKHAAPAKAPAKTTGTAAAKTPAGTTTTTTTAVHSVGHGGYTVKPGDNLSEIAAAAHLRGGWPALYRANKDTVGADPNLIFPGQHLTVG